MCTTLAVVVGADRLCGGRLFGTLRCSEHGVLLLLPFPEDRQRFLLAEGRLSNVEILRQAALERPMSSARFPASLVGLEFDLAESG